jgi:hypothetical protein
VLVIQTGMRRGELFGLTWNDVDLDNGWLHVKQALAPGGKSFNAPKTAKGRRKIRLTPVAVEALKRHKIAQNQERLRQGSSWQDYGLVFCSSVGTPMNPDNFVKRSYKPLLKRAGLPQLCFHDLRHTFASLMQPYDAQRASQDRPRDARALTDKYHPGYLLSPFSGYAGGGGWAFRGVVLLAGYCQTSVKRPRLLAEAFFVLHVSPAKRGISRARSAGLEPATF